MPAKTGGVDIPRVPGQRIAPQATAPFPIASGARGEMAQTNFSVRTGQP